MRRRTLLQLFGSIVFLPFIRVPHVLRVERPIDRGLTYTDSEGTDPAVLAALGDGVTDTGGVEYAA